MGVGILKVIYKRAGIKAKFVLLPSLRSLVQSSSGEIDGESQRIHAIGESYPTLLRVPTDYSYFEATAFSKNPKIKIDGWPSLNGYAIGITRGMKFAEQGVTGIKNIHKVVDGDQLFKMLDINRFDIIVTPELSGLFQLKRHEFRDIYLLKPT